MIVQFVDKGDKPPSLRWKYTINDDKKICREELENGWKNVQL